MSKKYPIEAGSAEPSQDALVIQQAKNDVAIRLLEKWMADESGYDEEAWPKVKKIVEENRLSYRRQFREFSK